MKRICMSAALVAALAGCGDAGREKALQDQVAMLQAEVMTLKTELDETRNGAPRLLARAEGEMNAGNYATAGKTLVSLIDRHPGTEQARKAELLQFEIKMKAEAAAEKARKEAERKAREEQEALARADQNLSKSTDEIKGITWVQHKSEPILKTKMALYFGTKDNSASSYPLRLRLQYVAGNWLFVDSVTVKADSETFKVPVNRFERDNGGGTIWEWSDMAVADYAILDKILGASRVLIRFEGRQYYKDFELPKDQKDAMKEMVLAWQRYGGKRT